MSVRTRRLGTSASVTPLGRRAARDDAALVRSVAEQCTESLREIYDRHSRAIFETARCILGQRALAEEVVQDVMLKLWNRPERFDPARGTLRAYLTTLAHGCAIDLARSESARSRREEREARLADRQFTVSTGDDLSLLRREVREAVDQLKPAERQAIALAYFVGYSYREVASRLGVPEGTVKNRIRSGLARLRSMLDAQASREPAAVSA